MIKVCTIDNPQTMRRESWQNGRLLCSYAMSALPPFAESPPAECYFFGANIGPWQTGQFVGDLSAMQPQQEGEHE